MPINTLQPFWTTRAEIMTPIETFRNQYAVCWSCDLFAPPPSYSAQLCHCNSTQIIPLHVCLKAVKLVPPNIPQLVNTTNTDKGKKLGLFRKKSTLTSSLIQITASQFFTYNTLWPCYKVTNHMEYGKPWNCKVIHLCQLLPKLVPLLVRATFGGRRHRLSSHHRSMFHFRFVLSYSFTPDFHSIN